MQKRKDFLVSTTKQWNCGDEFIWYGIRNIMQAIGFKANYILYNRHPSINPRPRLYRRNILKKKIAEHQDNSTPLEANDSFDGVIFAGTPEWEGPRLEPLFEIILRKKIPTFFLGIGWGGQTQLSEDLKTILKKTTRLVIGRDPHVVKLFSPYSDAHYEPCPSLFAVREKDMRRIERIQKIGFVFQGEQGREHSVTKDVIGHMLQIYSEIKERFDVLPIAHYVTDWSYGRDQVFGSDVRYSFVAEDYVEIYKDCDLIISTRIHACGLAASLGIPSICLPHDDRVDTVKGFKSLIINNKSKILTQLKQVNVSRWAESIVKHKKKSFSRYKDQVRGSLCGL